MTLIDSQLFLTVEEVAQWCSLSEAYLASAVSKGLRCWQPHEDNARLLAYEAMLPKYQVLIQRKTGGDPYRYEKDHRTIGKLEETTWQAKALPEVVEAMVEAADYERFRKDMNKADALDCARAASWLRLLGKVKGKHDAAKYGFDSKAEMYGAAVSALAVANLKPLKVSNVNYLQRRIGEFRKTGPDGLIPGWLNNTNAKKLTPEGERFLIALMADPHKPPYPMVARLYNREAPSRGWKKVTAMTCQNFLEQPDVKRKWWLGRHGEGEFYQEFDFTIRRQNASAPDVLWVMDGTPLDLYYQRKREKWNEKEQKHETRVSYYERAYLFLTIDAYSWKFIGWNLSTSETAKAVRDTLKTSVKGKMVLPRQLQSDRSAAIIAQDFLIEQLKLHNTPSRPYNPKSKIIEAVLGHFQSGVLRYFDNFAGLNITAKKLDSRYNPDFVHQNRQNVPNWDGLVAQMEEAVTIWNEMATKGRKSPNALYAHQSKGNEVGLLSYLDMFWEKRKQQYIYHQDGIHLTIDSEEVVYQVLDAAFYKKHIKDKFEVVFDRDCREFIYLYQDGKPVLLHGEPVVATQADLIPMALADQEEGSRERLNRVLKLKDTIKDDTRRELEEIQAEEAVKLGARYVFKEQLNIAETAMKKDWSKVLEDEFLD